MLEKDHPICDYKESETYDSEDSGRCHRRTLCGNGQLDKQIPEDINFPRHFL